MNRKWGEKWHVQEDPNPKILRIPIKIRADKQTIEDLEYCCEKTQLNRSDVIRRGIQKVKEEVDN